MPTAAEVKEDEGKEITKMKSLVTWTIVISIDGDDGRRLDRCGIYCQLF